jgi:hypothetical protein
LRSREDRSPRQLHAASKVGKGGPNLGWYVRVNPREEENIIPRSRFWCPTFLREGELYKEDKRVRVPKSVVTVLLDSKLARERPFFNFATQTVTSRLPALPDICEKTLTALGLPNPKYYIWQD